MRSKGALPVPYIVAIIIAVIVIAVLVYWFFVLSGKGNTQATDAFCRAKELTYCSQWAPSNFNPSSQPSGQRFCCGDTTYANECRTLDWPSQVDGPACRTLLGLPAQTPTSSATGTT
jgi:hypothetical protein